MAFDSSLSSLRGDVFWLNMSTGYNFQRDLIKLFWDTNGFPKRQSHFAGRRRIWGWGELSIFTRSHLPPSRCWKQAREMSELSRISWLKHWSKHLKVMTWLRASLVTYIYVMGSAALLSKPHLIRSILCRHSWLQDIIKNVLMFYKNRRLFSFL